MKTKADLERQLARDIKKVAPRASLIVWAYQGPDTGPWPGLILDAKGGRIDLEFELQAVFARYTRSLGLDRREEGLAQAFSVAEARDVTDPETGGLEPGFRHRGAKAYEQ